MVVSVSRADFDDYLSKKGNLMMKLSLICYMSDSMSPFFVNEYLDFEGNNDWAHGKACGQWDELVGTNPPESVAEAVDRQDELLSALPRHIEIVEDKGWWKVATWGVKPWNADEAQGQTQEEIPF